jgi:hypothetical protein
MSELSLEAFTASLYQEVEDIVTSEVVEEFPLNAFSIHCFGQILQEAGEVEDPVVGHVERRGLQCDGVAWDPDLGRLDVLIAQYEHTPDVGTLSKTDIETHIKRVATFLDKAMNDQLHKSLEAAHEGHDVALTVWEQRKEVSSIRIILLTNRTVRFREPIMQPINDIPVETTVWDLTRLHRLESSGQGHEAIKIDLEEHGHSPIPCLSIPDSPEGIQTWLAVIPGTLLADLYEKYGSRLLEGNVRSWLQARTKVNKGIRTTILEQPHRFLAYNNGITATASDVIIDESNGIVAITSLTDLQIVNGGQTTATIHNALKKDKVPEKLQNVSVQMKLTSLPSPETSAEIVPLISRFANSQNRISEADLSANSPFNIAVEELSRTIWAPPGPDDKGLQTHWFYERARGQYQVAVKRFLGAKQRDFKKNNPSKKKIIKTDLAKFETTWEQEPHIVSLGAQKCYTRMMGKVNKLNFKPDETWFQHLVAKAILFKEAEKIVMKLDGYGGFRANIVTYTLSYIFNKLQRRVDLSDIWKKQEAPELIRDAIRVVGQEVQEVITNPSGSIKNVTEWCKKEACWERVKEINVELQELVAEAKKKFPEGRPKQIVDQEQARSLETTTEEDKPIIQKVMAPGSEYWFKLAKWAKETDSLKGYQRSMSVNIGKAIGRGDEPSLKLSKQGEKIMEEAEGLGYKLES